MNINIIDLLGEEYHTSFDLNVAKCVESKNKTFFGSASQLEYFTDSGIKCVDIITPLKKGRFNKKISSVKNIHRANKEISADSINIVTGFENVSLALYSTINKSLLKNTYLFIHNNLSGLNRKWKIICLNIIFKNASGILFLDKSIRDQFLEDYPAFQKYRKKCFYIPHPIEFKENSDMKKLGQKKLSFIGRVADDKGASLLLKVLNKLPESIQKNIKIVGQVDGAIKEEFSNLFRNIEVVDNFLSTEQYIEAFRMSKFTFLLHDPYKFHYRTSGILYDSIRFGTPVICSNYYVYTTLFREFNPIGLILNEYEESELESLISQADNMATDDHEYQYFVGNISDLKINHSLENVSKILNKIVEE